MKNVKCNVMMPGSLDEFFDVVSALVSWRTLIKEIEVQLDELEQSGLTSEQRWNYLLGRKSVLGEHLRVELEYATYVHQQIMMEDK